jgi:large subunit ribosomal protein L13
MNTKTFTAKEQEVKRKWHLIDAKGQVVGKVAEAAANLLRGRDKAIYTPHADTGDFVVVINAKDVVFTGKKESKKLYFSHSGYVGGTKNETPEQVRQRRPELLIERAVKGMVPHTKLGRRQLEKLFVYADAEHEQTAQNPEPYKI